MNNISMLKSASLIAGLFFAGAVWAQDQNGAHPPVGTQTRALLDLQTSNSVASPVPRPLPGDIADRTYERYAKSFAKPIPDELGRDSFVEGGGGGSQ